MSQETKSENYVLIIDKDRDLFLGAMFDVCFANPLGHIFLMGSPIMKDVSQDVADSFAKEINEKRHSAGLCKEKNCKYKKKS